MAESAKKSRFTPGLVSLVLASLFVLLGATLVVSDARASWTAPADLSETGATPGSVLTAAGADGSAAVVWLDDGQVVASIKPSGADFGEPQHLGAGSFPQLAVNDDGRVLVAWISGNEVALAERDPDGLLIKAGTALRVQGISSISLAFNEAGRGLIAYVSPGRRGLVTRAVGERSFSPAWSTNAEASYGELKVGQGAVSDSATTVWSDSPGAVLRLYAVHWSAGAGAASKQVLDTVAPQLGSSSVIQVEIVDGDKPTVLYNVKTSAFGDTTNLRASTATDGVFGPAQQLLEQNFLGAPKLGPRFFVGAAPGGGGTIAWRTMVNQPGTVDWNYGVAMAQHDGSGLGATQPFLSMGHQAIELLGLGVLPDGRTAVLHQSDTEILAATRAADGSAEDGPFTIGGVEDGQRLDDVKVVGDQHGGLFAAWVRITENGNRIQVTSYDEEAPDATIIAPATATAGQPVSFSVKGDRWSSYTTAWNTGDGATPTGASISHVYDTPGIYEISATVTDAAGHKVTAAKSLHVSPALDPDPDPVPVASLSKVTVKGQARLKAGKKATFKVKITNSGDATATGIKVKITGRGVKTNGSAGSIAAGKTRIVKVKVKPKKTGRIKLRFQVTSLNAGKKTATKAITVRP